MITIPLSTEDFTKVRIAPSPRCGMVSSFRVLVRQGRYVMHAPCCRDDAVDLEKETGPPW
jgi:hypothetical protein